MIQNLQEGDILLLEAEPIATIIKIGNVTQYGFDYEYLYNGVKKDGEPERAILFNYGNYGFYDYQIIREITNTLTTKKERRMTKKNLHPTTTAEWGKVAGMEFLKMKNGDVFFDFKRIPERDKLKILIDEL